MLNYRLAIVTALVLLGPPAPAAQDEAAAKKGSGRTIELSGTVHGKFTARTAYLSQPIEQFHRLSLDGELGGKGRLSLDPNGCSVTEFGDTGICTKIAETVRDVTLRQEQSPDPTGAGRRLYQIEGAGLAAPIRLVTPPASGGGAYRLVYGMGGASPVVVVTLEATASAKGTPPEGGSANGEGGVAPANQKRGSVERFYEGESAGGTLQEALDGALQKLDKDLPEGGIADAMASWRLLDVSGLRGGFPGFRSVKVRIAATRTPPWTK